MVSRYDPLGAAGWSSFPVDAVRDPCGVDPVASSKKLSDTKRIRFLRESVGRMKIQLIPEHLFEPVYRLFFGDDLTEEDIALLEQFVRDFGPKEVPSI